MFSLRLLVRILFAVALIVGGASTSDVLAQRATPTPTVKPFRLPFREPSGPDTWYWIQAYGNTAGAYRQRKTTYGAGQGIHFGVDLAAPCRTEVVALADGVVAGVDGPFGSAPHNLMIAYPNGYASLYGHLYERPHLTVGQPVKAGDVVALSGDPDGTCTSRPHLHLEIRDSSFTRAFNPVTLIDADWDSLALISSVGRSFEKNLDAPREWQAIDDQPAIHFGSPLLNDFENAWPFSGGTDRLP